MHIDIDEFQARVCVCVCVCVCVSVWHAGRTKTERTKLFSLRTVAFALWEPCLNVAVGDTVDHWRFQQAATQCTGPW